MRQRDPKTGRFISNNRAAELEKELLKNQLIRNKGIEIQLDVDDIVEITLNRPLIVFDSKKMGKIKRINPGNDVIITKLGEIGPSGSNIIRVKRKDSLRSYFTKEENILKL